MPKCPHIGVLAMDSNLEASDLSIVVLWSIYVMNLACEIFVIMVSSPLPKAYCACTTCTWPFKPGKFEAHQLST